MDIQYTFVNKTAPFLESAVYAVTEGFPNDNVNAIVSCLFRPKEKRNEKLDDYLEGINFVVDACKLYNGLENRQKLCFILYIDEGVFDSKYNKEKQQIEAALETLMRRSRLQPNNDVAISVRYIRWKSFKEDDTYHKNLLPTIFRHLVPMIDPAINMCKCVDLDDGKALYDIIDEYCWFVKGGENSWQEWRDHRYSLHVEQMDKFLLGNKVDKCLYVSRTVYPTEHSWDIFNLGELQEFELFFTIDKTKKEKLGKYGCPTFILEALYCNINNHRETLVKVANAVNEIMLYVRDGPVKQIVDMEINWSEITLEDMIAYIKYQIYLSSINKYKEQKFHGHKTCGGRKPYELFVSCKYGIDELILISIIYPMYVRMKIIGVLLYKASVVVTPPVARSGGAAKKVKYHGYWYTVRTGSRNGRYIVVKGKKMYIR